MLKFWIKTGIIYGLVGLGFSLIGLGIDDICLECYDQERASSTIFNERLLVHILGHISFGMMIAIPFLSIRYIVAGGMFAIVLDSDHILHYILTFIHNTLLIDVNIYAFPRMGHSLLFGIIIAIVLILVFRKDIKLAVIGFTAIFSHMSFDIITGGSGFPLFTPFTNTIYKFPAESWIWFFVVGLVIIGTTKVLMRRKVKPIQNP